MKKILLNTDGSFKHWHTFQDEADAVEVTNAVAMELSQNTQTKQYDASTSTVVDVVPTQGELDAVKAGEERAWRDGELASADVDIFKAEDDGVETLPLRIYRQALRDYPQQGDFPHGTRPVA